MQHGNGFSPLRLKILNIYLTKQVEQSVSVHIFNMGQKFLFFPDDLYPCAVESNRYRIDGCRIKGFGTQNRYRNHAHGSQVYFV